MKHEYKPKDRVKMIYAHLNGGKNEAGELATVVEIRYNGTLMVLPDKTKGSWPTDHPDFKDKLLYWVYADELELINTEELLDEA